MSDEKNKTIVGMDPGDDDSCSVTVFQVGDNGKMTMVEHETFSSKDELRPRRLQAMVKGFEKLYGPVKKVEDPGT